MNKKNFKNVALATVLAVGLGMTGITAMAQEAEARTVQETCVHSWFVYNEETYYEEVSHLNHDKYVKKEMVCRKCHAEDTDWEITLEDHTLRMASTFSGHAWECIYCEYYE